jgi:tetratricopeptide (TPR) repeat protein
MRDPAEGDRERAGMLWSMMQTSFRRALDICPTIGGAYKVMVPPYEGIDNASIDQEMQFRDALAMDPNDAGLLRQYAIHLMQHGMNEEAVEVMRRAYDIEPLLPMIPFQLAHTLNRLGRCDEALELATEAEELGGQPKVAIEAACSWRNRDRDAMNAAGHRLIEVGMGFPFEAIEMSVEEFNEARLEQNSPLRPVMRERMRALWEQNPNPEKNMHVYWIVATATDIGDLDLVFDILETIANEAGFPGYTIAWSPLFVDGEDSSRLRADRRFVDLLEKTSYPGYWREYGWPTGCEPDGESFRCL